MNTEKDIHLSEFRYVAIVPIHTSQREIQLGVLRKVAKKKALAKMPKEWGLNPDECEAKVTYLPELQIFAVTCDVLIPKKYFPNSPTLIDGCQE